MDNKVFDVNGSSKAKLLSTLKLAMSDENGKEEKASAWLIDPKYGFVLLWSDLDTKAVKFPVRLGADALTDMIWEWLGTKEAKEMKFEGWDADSSHDGHNSMGFRVYCGDWGHVGSCRYAIIAIRPSYLWYGK